MPNDTRYPDPQDINTGTNQNSDPSTYLDTGQEGTSTHHKKTLIPAKGNLWFEKTTQGRQKPGGTNKDYVGTISHASVLDEFLKKPMRLGSKILLESGLMTPFLAQNSGGT